MPPYDAALDGVESPTDDDAAPGTALDDAVATADQVPGIWTPCEDDLLAEPAADWLVVGESRDGHAGFDMRAFDVVPGS